MMDQLLKSGRYLLAVSIAAFGIQYLAYGRLPGGLPPVPPWLPYASAIAYSTAAFLVVVSLGLLTGKKLATSQSCSVFFFFSVFSFNSSN
jgi:hypothetical protein